MGRLRQKTGLTTQDLPAESQWEYALGVNNSYGFRVARTQP
jgi:formylglycine-generating enzyme required for sulfatase activity